ncbi:MAG: DUF1859 domain-containing protein [Patescibacteria group bacterium]|nr:DUF1859 domain-containing protein [Patescibacteria group bacterium]
MPVRSAFQIPNKAVPSEGGVGVPVTLSLATKQTDSGDLTLEQTSGVIGFVQSVYIDNSANAAVLTLTFPGTQQNITVKGKTQGYYPVMPFTGTFSWNAASTGAVNVPIIFTNVRFEAAQWATA